MIILVTGGAGFIGRNLCSDLLLKNNKVICVDNLYSGSEDNIKDFLKNKNFTFIKHDICNSINLEKYGIKNIDQIYHLACPASPKIYQKDPLFTLDTCYIGTKNMLDLSLKYNAKILLTSTSEVYGEPLVHPQNELYHGNVNINGIRSCYDEGKRISETLMTEYKRKYNIDAKIVRLFNTYGPYMNINDGRVIINFIKQSLNNENITIWRWITNKKFLLYIDIIDSLRLMMNSDSCGPTNLGIHLNIK